MSHDEGNAAEQVLLKQNKQITKADSAEVNAGVSTKLIQVRVTIFAIFCTQHEVFPTGGPPLATTKYVMAPRWPPVGLRWEVRWPLVGCPGLSARG